MKKTTTVGELFKFFDPPLDEEGKYKDFNFPIPNTTFTLQIRPQQCYWKEENKAVNFCEKKVFKKFTNNPVILTRYLIGKEEPWKWFFKGPVSPFDFYIPDYAVGEIKYTRHDKDYWGYDLNERAIENAWTTVSFLDPYGINEPRMKFFYVIMHNNRYPRPEYFSLSVIDMYEKFKFVDDNKPLKEGQQWFARHGAKTFKINVSKSHCFFHKSLEELN